jgi:hypothetical protein
MRRWPRVLFVLWLPLLMAPACTDGDDASAARTTPTTEPPDTTSTTTTSPTTTTTPASGPPEWVAIAQDLYNRRHELRVHPNPAAVTTVIDQNCSCYANEASTVEFFATEGITYESRPNQVLSVAVRGEAPGGGLTFLLVDVQPSSVRLYNRDGSLYQETPAPPAGQVNLAVAPSGPNGEWRIHDEFDAG